MKIAKRPLTTLALTSILAFSATVAMASVEVATVNVPVNGAYAPTHGYDDNDTVKIVIDGKLPNLCYSQGVSEATVDGDVITITQKASRKATGDCVLADDKIPDSLKHSTVFMSEALVGQLDVGTYTVRYVTTAGEATRELNVTAATTASTDSVRYGQLSDAFVLSSVSATDATFDVNLTGHFSSACVNIKHIEVVIEDNVVTVLPILTMNQNYCPAIPVAFHRVVKVQTPAPGRYLLHTRSLGGDARNSLFDVVAPQ